MNDRQKRLLEGWRGLVGQFWTREWTGMLIGSAIGLAAAALERLFFLDLKFRGYLAGHFLPPSGRFDDIRLYTRYEWAAVILIVILILINSPRWLARGIRSWVTGCTSGMVLLFGLSVFFSLARGSASLRSLVIQLTAADFVIFCLCFAFFLASRVRGERDILEKEILVDPAARAVAGTSISESDEPIQSWGEDALGRAAIVDIIAAKAIISKSPIIAVAGPFGSGKTSVLNLLKGHLKDRSVIVQFSTWLPGSQDTLAAYLFADIASQCRKMYVVPGLRRSTRRIASALAETVPLLKGVLRLVPEPTQRDDFESLRKSLLRIPRRVLVLLDELDRMDKEEAITLLKILRGISLLPNLTFVCAVDIDKLTKTVRGEPDLANREYFEKFFPVVVPLPVADPEALRNAGVRRLTFALDQRGWFTNQSEREEFQNEISRIWNEIIAPFCSGLRAIGLFANDLGIAASLLLREVDPVDLAVIEMLRRFRPALYSLIGKHAQTLTGGESVLRGGDYISDAWRKRVDEEIKEELSKISESSTESGCFKEILVYLFPRFKQIDGGMFLGRRVDRKPDGSVDSSKRISNPSIFPAYFRYELPEAVFSSVELESFFKEFRRANGEAGRNRVFDTELRTMPKGSFKRDDFLRKLSELVSGLDLDEAIALAKAAIGAANEYTYDLLAAFGESGHALRILIRAAERLSLHDRILLLRECILSASDDTMSLRILLDLTNEKSGAKLGVAYSELYPAFIGRMRKQYGPDSDAVNLDLSSSDPGAFTEWGIQNRNGVKADPKDRSMQRDFWLRRINGSRARLGEVFDGFILPSKYHYDTDPTNYIECKLPVEDLRGLFDTLPQLDQLTEAQRRGLGRLKNFLTGRYSNGMPFGGGEDEPDQI